MHAIYCVNVIHEDKGGVALGEEGMVPAERVSGAQFGKGPKRVRSFIASGCSSGRDGPASDQQGIELNLIRLPISSFAGIAARAPGGNELVLQLEEKQVCQ